MPWPGPRSRSNAIRSMMTAMAEPTRVWRAWHATWAGGRATAQGRIVCVADGPPRCEGVPGEPEPEICNNLDDDCDGLTDEGDGEGEGRPMTRGCYPGPGGTEGIGICQAGTQVCNDGVYGACAGATLPLSERCNGIDDNCDLRSRQPPQRPLRMPAR
jgi:hypothetical protein